MCSQYLLPCKIYCRTTCNGSRRRGWRTGTHSHEKYKHVQKVYYDIIDTYQFLPCSNQNWKLRYFGLNKKVLQFYFRFWMYSWVVNKNYIKTFFCEDGNNSHSSKHEIYNLTWFTRKNCRISKLFSVMNKHWPRPYWNTLEHISAHHTLVVLAHNVQRLQITDLRPKTTHGAWGLSFCHRVKIDVARKRPW